MSWVLGTSLAAIYAWGLVSAPTGLGLISPSPALHPLFIVKVLKALFHVPLGLGHEGISKPWEVLVSLGSLEGLAIPWRMTGICLVHPSPAPNPSS